MDTLPDPWAPVFIVAATAAVVAAYPASDRWSPAREDSTAILGGWTGIRIGFWATFQVLLSTTGLAEKNGQTLFVL